MLEHIKVAEKIDLFDVEDALEQIDKVNETMPLMDRKVAPYSFWMTVEELLRPAREYNNYTRSSQQTIKAEVFGLIPIINSWIDYYNEDDVIILMTSGKNKGEIITTKRSTANMFIECGYAEEEEVCFNE